MNNRADMKGSLALLETELKEVRRKAMMADAGISTDDLEHRKVEAIGRFQQWADEQGLDTRHHFYAAMCRHISDSVEIGFFGMAMANLDEEEG